MSNKIFSLLNYVGHKSKILDDIFNILPKEIDGTFWDIFCGSSVVGLSSPFQNVNFVDNNKYLIELYSSLTDPNFLNVLESTIQNYGLTNSCRIPRSQYLKSPDIGTCMWHGKVIKNLHLDKLNEEGYKNLLKDFNNGIFSSAIDRGIVYMILTIYGRNSNVSIKKDGGLSGGVGPLDFSVKAGQKLQQNILAIKSKNVNWINDNFSNIHPLQEDLVYLDPPYLASGFKYSGWDNEDEKKLLEWVDKLPCNWILSNVFISGKNSNDILQNWAKNFKVIYVDKNYRKWAAKGKSSAERDNKKNAEVLITNIT